MDRLIARNEEALERQRRIIAIRLAAGHDVTAETRLLESLERTQAALKRANTLLDKIKSAIPGWNRSRE